MAEHVTIITGASRGVGRAAAVELARRGGRVALVARDKARLEETARLCEATDGGGHGARALVAVADITREGELAAAVERTIEAFGRLDGVVNNAGYAPQAGVEETDAALFERTLAVNLASAMTLSRLAWPHLRVAAAGGRADRAAGAPGASGSAGASPSQPAAGPCIVNLSSMSAVDPLPGFVAYAAAKAGLLGLTKALAREGDAVGIRSVAIILGGVETEMFRGLKGVEGVPPEALLSPEEVGRVIAECVMGPLGYSSGEGIYLRKRL